MLACLLGLAWMPASVHGQRVQLQDFFGSSQPNVGLPTPPNTLPTILQNFPALPSGIPNGLPQIGLPQIQSGIPQPVLPSFDGFSPSAVQLPQIVSPPGIGQTLHLRLGLALTFRYFPESPIRFQIQEACKSILQPFPAFKHRAFKHRVFKHPASKHPHLDLRHTRNSHSDRSPPPAGLTKARAVIGCQQLTGLTQSNFGRIFKTTFYLGYLNGPEPGKHGSLATATTS